MNVFVDIETVRLAPGVGVVWEIALVVPAGQLRGQYHWQIKPDLTIADPKALEINRYHERIHPSIADHPEDTVAVLEHPDYVLFDGEAGSSTLARVAEEVAALTNGADLWGSNPAFDMHHLELLLHDNGAEPTWHYHPYDLASMCAGWCAAMGRVPVSAKGDGRIRSDDWSRAIGVDPAAFDRHTALGDARWCQAQYDHMTGAGPGRVSVEYQAWWHAGDGAGICLTSELYADVNAAHRIGAAGIGEDGITRYTVHRREHGQRPNGSRWTGPWEPVEASEVAAEVTS